MADKPNTFLDALAEHLVVQYGERLSDKYILFPNRRSRLFFIESLSRVVERPMWQPHYVSMDELMEQIAGVRTGERLRLIAELYKIYLGHFPNEGFDKFFYWGEMMLRDFDDIDNYNVNAKMLFTNISDLKALESNLSYLTPQQRQVVTRFWAQFYETTPSRNNIKESFMKIWHALLPIYTEFKQRLSQLGIASAAGVARMAAEAIESGRADVDLREYIVVGFNTISECERIVFDRLNAQGAVEFYWDTDDYYTNDPNQTAGMFLRQNIQRYAAASRSIGPTDNFGHCETVRVVSAASDALQCKYVASLIDQIQSDGHPIDRHTAIILNDENLLMPLLYSLPDSVGGVNVTLGYPVRKSLEYSFVERLLMLQTRARQNSSGQVSFYHADVSGLLTHPFLRRVDGEQAEQLSSQLVERMMIHAPESLFKVGGTIEHIFTLQPDPQQLSNYIVGIISEAVDRTGTDEQAKRHREIMTAIVEHVRRLSNSIAECQLELTLPIYRVLLRRSLLSLSVPFTGEPLNGLQVMGMVETRNLDFDTVIVLSMNDDIFPSKQSALSSFIPFNLRVGYGLPTYRQRQAVSSYYFYRLLQRARHVELVYCNSNDENRSAEPSRFVYQLQMDSPLSERIEYRDIAVDVNFTHRSISVDKDAEVMQRLNDFLVGGTRLLAPTTLYTYLDCPLKFYFKAVARLRDQQTIEEQIDMPMFGSILHKAMELLYRPLIGCHDTQSRIKALIDSETVAEAVRRAIAVEFFAKEDVDRQQIRGNILFVNDVVIRYINRAILPFDSRRNDFTIEQTEPAIECDFDFNGADSRLSIRLGGKADRIDRLADGTLRVVDYKTGNLANNKVQFKGVDSLVSGNGDKLCGPVLQTLIYSIILNRNRRMDVVPMLYFVRYMNASVDDSFTNIYDSALRRHITSFEPYRQQIEDSLGRVLGEIFDYRIPFSQCADKSTCTNCGFNVICNR